MTFDEKRFRDHVYKAHFNKHAFRELSLFYAAVERGSALVSALAASAAFLSLVTKIGGTGATTVLSGIATVLSIALTALEFKGMSSKLSQIHGQWIDAARDMSDMMAAFRNDKAEPSGKAYKAAIDMMSAAEKSEPPFFFPDFLRARAESAATAELAWADFSF